MIGSRSPGAGSSFARFAAHRLLLAVLGVAVSVGLMLLVLPSDGSRTWCCAGPTWSLTWRTALLLAAGTALAVAMGIPLGVFAAKRRRSAKVGAVVGESLAALPIQWFTIVLLLVAIPAGRQPSFSPGGAGWFLLVLSLAIPLGGLFSAVTRQVLASGSSGTHGGGSERVRDAAPGIAKGLGSWVGYVVSGLVSVESAWGLGGIGTIAVLSTTSPGYDRAVLRTTGLVLITLALLLKLFADLCSFRGRAPGADGGRTEGVTDESGVTGSELSRRFGWMHWTGVTILVLTAIVALSAPALSRYSPDMTTDALRASPSSAHWLGTDDGGFDIATLLVFGLRSLLITGVEVTALAVAAGWMIGWMFRQAPGWIAALLGWVIDYLSSVPPIVILLALTWTGMDPWSPAHVLALGLLLSAIAARAVGQMARTTRLAPRGWAIMMLPAAATTLAFAFLYDSALSYLVGRQGTLGTVLRNAFDAGSFSRGEWWMFLPVGLLLTWVVLGCRLVAGPDEEKT